MKAGGDSTTAETRNQVHSMLVHVGGSLVTFCMLGGCFLMDLCYINTGRK